MPHTPIGHSRIFKDSHGQIADAISIRERSAELEDRAIPIIGRADLLSGSNSSRMVTLVNGLTCPATPRHIWTKHRWA